MLLLTANTTGLSGISRLDLFAKTVVIEACPSSLGAAECNQTCP